MSGRAESSGGRPRVGYLGPAGTFSEEALLSSAQADAVEPFPLASIYDTVMALRRGEVELGDRADRELARGVDQRRRSTCWRGTRATWRSSARRCCV